MKKTLFSFALLFLFAFVLTACGNGEEENGDDNGDNGEECVNRADEGVEYFFDQDQAETTTITLWLDNEDYANAIISEFEEENPGIRVRFSEVGSVDVRQQLELYSGSTAAGDVVMFPHDHIGAALQSNLLYPIEGGFASDIQMRMILSSVETATACYDYDTNQVVDCEQPGSESVLFGAPLSGESVALFYNKTLLEELTGSAEPEDNLSFERIIEQYYEYQDELEEDYGDLMIALDVGNAYDMHFLATAFGYQLFGPDGLDSDAVNLNSEEMLNALTFMYEELRPALANRTSGDLDGESNRTLFEEGNLPYIVDGPWSISRYVDAGIDFGVMRLPMLNDRQPLTFSGVQMGAVYSGTENPDAAFRLLEFMASDRGLEIMYETTNRLPALEDVSNIEGVGDDEFLSGISDQLNYSVPMPIIPEMGFFWDNAGNMYGAVWNGDETPQDAADEAQSGYESSAGN